MSENKLRREYNVVLSTIQKLEEAFIILKTRRQAERFEMVKRKLECLKWLQTRQQNNRCRLINIHSSCKEY